MLKFIKSAIELANVEDDDLPDLIDILRKNMGGYEAARGFAKIHASDITKDGFCPRQVALLDITGGKPKGSYVNTALRATYDLGNAAAELLRSKWLGEHAFGNWRCRVCRTLKTCGFKPKDGFCHSDLHGKYAKCDWVYEEMEFVSDPLGVSGSIDVLVRHGQRLMITELKIMAPDEFEKLLAPLSEHRIRTNLYMRLVDDSTSPWKSMIMTDRAKVLYVSRAFGKHHAQYNEILPFKQFVVERDDVALEPMLRRARAARAWRQEQKMPGGICPTLTCKQAKGCPVSGPCFSGEHPACTS